MADNFASPANAPKPSPAAAPSPAILASPNWLADGKPRTSTEEFALRLGLPYAHEHEGDGSAHDEMMTSAHNTADDPEINQLLENNKLWVHSMNEIDPSFFYRLGQGQAPKYLYFGCSDSRVPANQILGLPPGQVFVHRNVGNLVPANDLNSLTVLEYAVEYLDVRHIIVAGHYECGAVAASVKPHDHGFIENWIRNIRDVYRLHHKTLDKIDDIEDRKRRLVELNVVEQCLNLYKTSVVQRKRLKVYESGGSPFVYPRIHGLVFDPRDGILKKLPINFRAQVETYKHIYNLYKIPTRPQPAAQQTADDQSAQPQTQPTQQQTQAAQPPSQQQPSCGCSHGNHQHN